MDAAQLDNSGDARSSLKVMEPSNLHAHTNTAALIGAIRGASNFGVDPGSRGVRSGADAARPLTNGGLAKLSGMEVQNVILPNTQSINGL